MPVGVLDDDLRVQVALVLHDRPALVRRRRVASRPAERLALDDVLVADLAADLGEDRDVVRVPLAERSGRGLTFWPSSTSIVGAVGDVVLLELAALGVEDLDLAVARQGDLLALASLIDDVDADELDVAVAASP